VLYPSIVFGLALVVALRAAWRAGFYAGRLAGLREARARRSCRCHTEVSDARP
jgi:hypothetical protein